MIHAPNVGFPLTAREHKGPNSDCDSGNLIAHTLRADGFDASEDGTGRGTPLVPVPILEAGARTGKSTTDPRAGIGIGEPGDPMYAGGQVAVAFQSKASAHQSMNPSEVAPTLDVGKHDGLAVAVREALHAAETRPYAVRRITPREAERLQGFPDDYTMIPLRRSKRGPSAKMLAKYPDLYELGEDGIWTHYAADGTRYKALGNSMAVVVMEWIGQRIQMVETIASDMEAVA